MKRFRSNLYTAQKIVCADRQHVYVENEDGYLFAQAIYPTKIKAEDLFMELKNRGILVRQVLQVLRISVRQGRRGYEICPE